jgi:hypothetical protein
MYLLSWIVAGLIAGWLGGKILKGDGYGTVMDIAMGSDTPRGFRQRQKAVHAATLGTELDIGGRQHYGEVATEQYVALISSS